MVPDSGYSSAPLGDQVGCRHTGITPGDAHPDCDDGIPKEAFVASLCGRPESYSEKRYGRSGSLKT